MKNSLRFPFSFNRALLALKNNRKIFALALAFFAVVGMAQAQTPTVKTSYTTDLTPSSYVATAENTTFSVNVFVDLVENGSSSATEVGLVYSTTNANPELNGSGVTKKLRNNTALGSSTVSLSGLPIHQDIYVRAFATNDSGTAYGDVMVLKFEDWTLMRRDGNTYNFFDARNASGGNGTTAGNLTTFRSDASLFEKTWLASSGGYNNLPTAYFKLRGKSNYPYLYKNGILDVSATVLNAQPDADHYNVKGFSIENFSLIRVARSGTSAIKYLMFVSSWYGYDDDPGMRASDYGNVLCPVAYARYFDTKPTINLAQGKASFCTIDNTDGDNSSSYARTAGKYYEFYIIKGHTSNASSGDYTTFVNENGTPTPNNGNFTALTPYAGFTEEWWLCNEDGTPYTGSEVTLQGNKVTYVNYFTTETKLQLHLKTTSTQNPAYFYVDPSYKEITFYPQSAPTSITATPSYMTLLTEDTKSISYTYESANTPCPYINITATSANTGIATVQATSNGFDVTGVAEGTTTITINALNPNGGVACSFDVTVEVSSEAELPDPTNGTGIVGNVVYLDDREDHGWSYYSDHEQPIRSLNPADVRIVYFGNGRKNMANASETGEVPSGFSANAEGVQVNVGEAQDTYYYIKTLERTDGATANSVAEAIGRCEYTTIPSPFQVRPVFAVVSSKGGNTPRGDRSTYTTNFNNVTPTGIDGTANLPDGWYSYRNNSSYVKTPHVSNNTNFSTFTDYDGNYLVFGARRVSSGNLGYGYAIAPKYGSDTEGIKSIKFRCRHSNTSYGQLSVGYVTDNSGYSTYTDVYTVPRANNWNTEYEVPQSLIDAINNNNGYLAFRFASANNTTYYYAAIDDVKVEVVPKHDVVIASGITGGTVSASPSNSVEGATITLNITPNGNNNINSVTVIGNDTGNPVTVSGTGNTRTFVMPAEDVTVNVAFNNAHTITILSNAAGSVTASPSSAALGAQVNLTISPNSGYALSSITVTGNDSGNTVTVSGSGNSRSFTMPDEDVTISYSFFNSSNGYRGFYAWRVKKVYGGTIYDAATNGNVIAKGDIIHADQTVWFEPTDENSMRVELVALWAQAYVNSNTYVSNGAGGDANYQCAYERNFKVATSGNLSTYTYPVTISTLYPNATTGTPSSRSMSADYTCSNDVKLENMTITNGGSLTLNANGKNLVVGRGVSGTINNLVGLNADASTGFRMRIESGTYHNLSFLGSAHKLTAGKLVSVFGSDYDRANLTVSELGDNTKLRIDTDIIVGRSTSTGNCQLGSTAGEDSFHCTVKSGNFDLGTTNYAGGSQFYLSIWGSGPRAYGKRTLVVEGGIFSDIAGGMEEGINPAKGTKMVDIRIKGGMVNSVVYGAAQYSGAQGDRRMVFTGGTVKGWIAGGCNGTRRDGGELEGSTYIYFGGNAKVVQDPEDFYFGKTGLTHTSSGQTIQDGDNGAYGGYIFGAGCGIKPYNYNASNPGASLNTLTVGKVFGSTIVIADNAEVGRDVYGGGNFGFVANKDFGGTNNNTDHTTKIYFLGGTIHGDIQGGSNEQNGEDVEIYMRGGELVGRDVENPAYPDNSIDGDIYAGSDTWGTINGKATIEMTGGTVHGNVFGGGFGERTDMKDDCTVTIKGGLVMTNVYGGGNAGTSGKTSPVNVTVNIMGGKVLGDVYGGALGLMNKIHVVGVKTVNIGVGADGEVSSENCYIGGSVYGGSRRAADALTYTDFANATALDNAFNSLSAADASNTSSYLNIASGYIQYHVFGSGFFGKTFGSTKVFIGQNAINNAPDHKLPAATDPANGFDAPNILRINGNVYGGADYGQYDGTHFGDPTIAGYAHIYIDGLGYNTQTDVATADRYMNLGGSVYGCGTSCYSGKLGSDIFVRNYGYAVSNSNYNDGDDEAPYQTATRSLQSLQFASNLIIENSNIQFAGQGKINSLSSTEKYSFYEISKFVRVVNGSGLFLDYPINEIKALGSYSSPDVYAASPSYSTISLDDLENTDNKIRVNNGAAIYVYRSDMLGTNQAGYGQLDGFFHLMNDDENVCYLYARPRQSSDSGNTIAPTWNNANDGGYVSYFDGKNTYSEGDASSTTTAPGHVDADGVQIPYENHAPASKGDSEYFRIWEYRTGLRSTRDGVFDAHVASNNTYTYSVAEVVIDLPACVSGGRYRIKTDGGEGGYIYIDYGDDVKTFNVANTVATGRNDTIPNGSTDWMSFNGTNFVLGQTKADVNTDNGLKAINAEPDLRFGLVMIPAGGLLGDDPNPALVYNSANSALRNMVWENEHPDQNPQMRFLLTYSNALMANAALDPITIIFEQFTDEGVVDEVEVRLQVVTSTSITQVFETEVYAIMKGKGTADDTYTARVTFPQYQPNDIVSSSTNTYSEWTLESVTWHPGENVLENGSPVTIDASNWLVKNGTFDDVHKFAMTCVAGLNADNQNGWERTNFDEYDSKSFAPGSYIASSFGRNPASVEFTLHYNGAKNVYDEKGVERDNMGYLEFHFNVSNCKDAGAPDYIEDVQVNVKIMRVGKGRGWYIDGVNGDNNYSGEYPNQPMRSLGAILSHADYQPGDDIYIVNQVSTGNEPLTWSGWDYDGITLYRYPGGHPLADDSDPTTFMGVLDYQTISGGDHPAYMSEGELIPANPVPYTGTLVNVTSDMTMQMITLDGSYGSNGNNVESSAPLITVADGCTLTMVDNTTLQNNYNESGNGGGIVMGDNSTLNMDRGATIENNRVGTGYEGGGVYMSETSTMNVDNEVTVYNNHEGTGNGTQSNVYLPAYSSVVNLGEHLDTGNSTIGVTKTEFFDPAMDQLFPYTPVAYSDFPSITEAAMGSVIKDDMNRYSIEIYDESHLEYPNYYDYFLGTWFSAVTSNPGNDHIQKVGDTYQIKTDEGLAWAISIVNGRTPEDGGTPTTPQPGADFTLVNDIDMSDNIWVPIGNEDHPYTGTFDGNGHAVTGLQSPLYRDDMGMFGQLGDDAEVKNVMAQVEFRDGNMTNIGSIAGTMADGATISNCEGGGTLKGNAFTENIGGLVGKNLGGDIKNSFAVNDIIAEGTTTVGGLVGSNGDDTHVGGDIINNFANPSFQVAATVTAGGLAGVNYGLIENCYSRLRSAEPTLFGWFAGVNASGHTIQYCYAPVDKSNYVYDNQGTLQYHSNYASTDAPNRKYKYAHQDQDVTEVSGNSYIENGALDYDETTHVVKIKGLLATLNNWVAAHEGYSTWTRTMASPINDDYPVHTMDNMTNVHFNCVGSEDGVFLFYDDNVNDLWEDKGFKDMTNGAMYMYAVQPVVSSVNDPVTITGNTNVPLYIHENVGITQADDAELTARVGVTFDNSDGSDFGGQLYDWHMFSTPLSDAPLGIDYTTRGEYVPEYGAVVTAEDINVGSECYFPSSTPFANFDFYAYDEASCHWINLKRNTGDHWHQTTHEPIDYTNENTVTPGKGYLMAVVSTTMLMADGTLNNTEFGMEMSYSTEMANAYDDELKGVNLIGNPYQSYLDFDEFVGNSNNEGNVLDDAYYLLDADMGGYIVYPKQSSSNPEYAPQYLHPHQGFFVAVKEGTSQLTFTNDMRRAEGNEHSYFRGEHVDYPLVNLVCTDGNGKRDLTTVEINRPELGGARKLRNMRAGDALLYAHYSNSGYQALYAPQGVREVPVRLEVFNGGVFTLTWSMYNGDFNYIHLIDNLTGADIDMLQANEYRFEASTDDYTSRFRLVFDVTGLEEYDDENGNGISANFAFFDGNSWTITGEGALQLFDLNGRCLMSTNTVGAQSSITLPKVAAGVYMLRLSNSQNTQVQKIVVK